MRFLALVFVVGCTYAQHPMLPDPKITPGATDPRVTQANIQSTICKSGYTATVRNVTQAEKKAVLQLYALGADQIHLVEIDHLVSLELAGSNELKNLWPQYYLPAKGQTGYLGARVKDVLETWLKRQVCAGKIPLAEAQHEIATDWVAAYRKYGLDKGKGSVVPFIRMVPIPWPALDK